MKKFAISFIVLTCLALFATDSTVVGRETENSAGNSRQPNFLIVLADDVSANTLGCYGSKNPKTSPNIDQLATEGIKFNNMFVAQATCAPTRAELYTGLLPFSNGTFTNHRAAKKGTLSIPHYLEKLGYRVGLAGKRHVKPKTVYPFANVKGFQGNCNHRGPTKDDWSGLEEFITANPDQPFCMVLASTHAHAPWDAGDSSHWDLDKLVLPENLADTPETRNYFREYLAEVREFDRQVGEARALLQKHDLEKETVIIVLDENGAGMPGGKWTTFDWGVRSACIMKWPAPHNHVFETDAITQYCDILPTMIQAAGGDVPENLDGKSLLDLIKQETTTHRDYGYFVHNTLPNVAKFSSRAITDGRYKLIWTLTPDQPFYIRVINAFENGYVDKMEDRHVRKMYQSWVRDAGGNETTAQRLNRFRNRPQFALFDLDSDPMELNNLAGEEQHAAVQEKLLSQLKTIMSEQNDPGILASASAQEASRTWPQTWRERELARFDTNSDGNLSMEEAGRNWKRDYASADNNQDGLLDAAELLEVSLSYLETGGKRTLNVHYKETEEESLYLDLYYPDKTDSPVPVVIFTHGGGWGAGNKQGAAKGVHRELFLNLVENGFCVAAINYRLVKRDKVYVPSCVEDCKDAIRYLAKNAEMLGLDPQRFITYGNSAGGHLSLMNALSPETVHRGDPELEGATYKIVAGVSFYGWTDLQRRELFIKKDRPMKDPLAATASRVVRRGLDADQKAALLREFSPSTWLTETSPPLLLFHGDQDQTVIVEHAHFLGELAVEQGANVETVIVDGAGHGFSKPGITPTKEEIIERVTEFCKQHSKIAVKSEKE